MRGLLATTSALLLMLVPISSAPAQSTDAGPALGVARISLINGDVTTKRGDSGDWVAAQVNEPVVEGDIIETAPGSRMELQLDYANIIRLDGSTSVEIAELGNRRFRVRLLEGRITYSELKNGEADIDIETPLVAVRPRERGRYEVAVQGDETIVVVRRGKTEIASINGIETLDNGRMMIIRDNGTGPEFRVERASNSDGWDDWNRSRDDRLSDVRSYQYVSEDIVGAGDLDHYGDWTYVSGYGHCWYPRGVGVGWAPYRQGRWLWSGYYGWTWAGYEPWGWAPYHYGRWFYSAGRGWGWWPGYRHHRQFYRPALVSFFGYGGGRGFSFGVGIGFGNVGWVALAPGERYRPWYGRGYGGRGGNQTIIVDNSVNIYNNYRNARAHNGVTVVDANGFSRGQVNNPRSLRAEELQRASLVRGQIPVAPARESQGRVVRASARGNNSVAARTASVRTYSRGGGTASTRSARLERTSFDQQRQQVVTSVRSFQQERSRNGGSSATGSVRSTNAGAARGAMSGADTRSRTTVRGGAGGTTSVSRSEKVGASSVRSGSTGTTRSGGWRSLGDRSRTTQRSSRSSVTTPSSSSRVNRSPSVRSNSSTQRSGSSRSSAIPQRSTSRVGSASRSDTRSSSRSRATVPQRSSSRVDRSSGSSRSASRAKIPQRSSSRVNRSSPSRSSSGSWTSRSESRSRATVPQRSSSRVQRSSRGSSRVNRAPSSSRSSSPSRMSMPQARAPRSSGSYNRSSGRSAPCMSSPSRSRAPSMRSAPSRSSGGARSGGSVRSAPSRGRSGRSK